MDGWLDDALHLRSFASSYPEELLSRTEVAVGKRQAFSGHALGAQDSVPHRTPFGIGWRQLKRSGEPDGRNKVRYS